MRTLPRDIASFTGRQLELEQLAEASGGSGGVAGIHAIGEMAGVGKDVIVDSPFPLIPVKPGGNRDCTAQRAGTPKSTVEASPVITGQRGAPVPALTVAPLKSPTRYQVPPTTFRLGGHRKIPRTHSLMRCRVRRGWIGASCARRDRPHHHARAGTTASLVLWDRVPPTCRSSVGAHMPGAPRGDDGAAPHIRS
jgi:hypothetical protein